MKILKSFKQFKESIIIDLDSNNVDDILESLMLWHDVLLSSVNAKEEDIYVTFRIPNGNFIGKLDLDFLSDNVDFINSLTSNALKKSEINDSNDYQTFLNKPCRYMFIYDINSNELENPKFILFQAWLDNMNEWDDVKLYSINDDVKKFYDKLTSRVIEILDGDDNYIYSTSNGNEWILQNIDKENDVYKRSFRKEEFQDLLSDKNVKVNIL